MAGTKNLATNKKARHEYFIEETYECGYYRGAAKAGGLPCRQLQGGL